MLLFIFATALQNPFSRDSRLLSIDEHWVWEMTDLEARWMVFIFYLDNIKLLLANSWFFLLYKSWNIVFCFPSISHLGTWCFISKYQRSLQPKYYSGFVSCYGNYSHVASDIYMPLTLGLWLFQESIILIHIKDPIMWQYHQLSTLVWKDKLHWVSQRWPCPFHWCAFYCLSEGNTFWALLGIMVPWWIFCSCVTHLF